MTILSSFTHPHVIPNPVCLFCLLLNKKTFKKKMYTVEVNEVQCCLDPNVVSSFMFHTVYDKTTITNLSFISEALKYVRNRMGH